MRWSYSKEGTYRNCPLKYKLKYIEKLPEEQGKAASRGSEMHEDLEKHLGNRDLRVVPEWMHKHVPILQPYAEGLKEIQLYLNDKWELCDKKDAWFTCIIDLLHLDDNESTVIDYKSGRVRDYSEQINLYSLATLAANEHLERAVGRVYFLDKKPGTWDGPFYLDRKSMQKLQHLWEDRIERMISDTRFSPRPNRGCEWCSYSKSKGGPCQFG